MKLDSSPNPVPSPSPVKFAPGDVVIHALTGERGVIIEVDERFCGPDDMLRDATSGRAPKNRPWYYLLIDGREAAVYVAERHLEFDSSGLPIRHPLVDSLFTNFQNGRYILLIH